MHYVLQRKWEEGKRERERRADWKGQLDRPIEIERQKEMATAKE